jgi:hypothetical protein
VAVLFAQIAALARVSRAPNALHPRDRKMGWTPKRSDVNWSACMWGRKRGPILRRKCICVVHMSAPCRHGPAGSGCEAASLPHCIAAINGAHCLQRPRQLLVFRAAINGGWFRVRVLFLKGHRQHPIIAHISLAPLSQFQPRLYGYIHHTDM